MATRNYREVWEGLKEAYEKCGKDHSSCRLREGMLCRGGDLDLLDSVREVGGAKTVLNLRMRPDGEWLEKEGVRMLHFPFRNSGENASYETKSRENRCWLREIMTALGKMEESSFPLYVHCRSGKDRTGVVIALLLVLLGVPLDVVIEDYLNIAEGTVKREWIETALVDVYDTRQKLLKCFSKSKLPHLEAILASD
mmetsp:Transcript_3334/g.11718  ORF Transcript_3334/g.11718 Transcript_3334/m.11718 type:complete len:196 (-) Transcript_3334:32-619(-)